MFTTTACILLLLLFLQLLLLVYLLILLYVLPLIYVRVLLFLNFMPVFAVTLIIYDSITFTNYYTAITTFITCTATVTITTTTITKSSKMGTFYYRYLQCLLLIYFFIIIIITILLLLLLIFLLHHLLLLLIIIIITTTTITTAFVWTSAPNFYWSLLPKTANEKLQAIVNPADVGQQFRCCRRRIYCLTVFLRQIRTTSKRQGTWASCDKWSLVNQ